MSRRLSGLQREVLSLQRALLRAARVKEGEARRSIELFVNAQFRKNATEVDRKDFQTIEYLLRQGKKQLDMLQARGVSGISLSYGGANLLAAEQETSGDRLLGSE